MAQDKSKSQNQTALSKADKVLGKGGPNAGKSPKVGNPPSTGSVTATPPEIEAKTLFKDEQTIPFDRSYGPLAQFAATQLLKDRPFISQKQYERNVANFNLLSIPSQPLSIQTKDGAKLSALEIGDPNSEQCLIVFQPKDGNFKDLDALENLFKLAEATGARVIAFNYRDKPASLDSLDYDGCAVTQYAMSRENGTPANKITFYGESLGGAVASETAGKLADDENKEVKVICGRAPNSLAEAVKHMDVDQLIKETSDPAALKDLKTLKTIQKLPIGGLQVGVKLLFGRDLKTEESLKKLPQDNVVRFRVKDDAMATDKSTASKTTAEQILVGVTKNKDKHNAKPAEIIFPTSGPESKENQGINKAMTGEKVIVDHVKREIQPKERLWKT